jgi:hypothetical protein
MRAPILNACLTVSLLVIFSPRPARAQTINTVAGTGNGGSTGNEGSSECLR